MTGRLATIFTLLVLAGPAMAANRDHPRNKEEEACQADVFRVCNDAVPDEKLILACLQKKLPDLSAACQRMVEPDPSKRTKQF